ncbi:MAG: hypothetical protein ACP5PK_02925 [candidate division WOR-3 bacterium]
MSLLSAALLLVRALPFEPAIVITRLLVITYLLFRPDYRREIEVNYKLLFNRRDRFFWLRNAWTVGRNIALMAKIGTKLGAKLIDRATVYQENMNDECVRRENDSGSLMVSFHFGLWEFLPQFYRNYGNDVAVVTGVMKDKMLSRTLVRLRSGSGVRIISDIKSLRKRLGQSGITGFMLDNTSRGKMTDVVVKSLRIRLPAMAFVLSRRTGTGVVPVFSYLKHGRLTVRVFPEQDAAGCARLLLEMVREMPTEWIFWGKSGAVISNLSN